MDKLIGFAPDADPTTTGVLTACTNIIPGEKGMESAPIPVNAAVTTLASECTGSALIVKLDDSRRMFAGTDTHLYELDAGSWTDRSGATYTGTGETRWSFAQFGDATLASNLQDTIQRSTTGAFASISGAPKAKIIYTVGGFVMALHTDDTGFGLQQDRWWCSAAYDDTDWTPSVTTQATTGRLVSAPGRITAGGRLGDYAVAYKDKAIYLGQYVGAPVVWDWQQIPGGEAGCVGQDAWCDVGGAHFVVGYDNFWLFDGSRPVPIGTGTVRQWFYDNSDPAYRYQTRCTFDRQNGRVWVFYVPAGSYSHLKALVYHVAMKQWGLVDVETEAEVNYFTPGYTIDGLTALSSTIDALPDVTFDSQFWLSGGIALSIFNTSHQLQTMTGSATSSSMTTWIVGDDDLYSLLSKVRTRFGVGSRPTAATLTAYAGPNLSEMVLVTSSSLNDGKFDVLSSGRWHQALIEFTGPHTTHSVGFSLTQEGDR